MAKVSTNARVVLAWCATHQHETATREVAGKVCRVINLNWHGLAQACGFKDDHAQGATRASLDAIDELVKAGCLANVGEGPGTFGHSTLVFVPQSGGEG